MLTLRAALPCGRQFASLMANVTRHSVGKRSLQINENSGLTCIGIRWSKVTPVQQQFQQQQQHRMFATEATEKESRLTRIYYGTLAPRMKLVKLFSLTTSLAGLAAQPVLMEQGMKIGGTGMAVFFCTVAGFFTFVTPLLLHFITKKYVTELHYNPATDEYTATTISLLLTKIQTKFRTSDVTVPEVPGMFSSFIVNKRPLFVDPSLFDDPEHYVRIMGFDKPIDFKLDVSPERNTQKTQTKQQ